LINRSFCASATGDYASALQDLDAALALTPDAARVQLLKAHLLQLVGRTDEAQRCREAALRTTPVTVDDIVSQALAFLPNEPARAAELLRAARPRFGSDATLLQSLAHVSAEHLGKPAEALEALDALLDSRPGDRLALAGRGVLHARAGSIALALKDARAVEALAGPCPPPVRFQLSCIYALCSLSQPELQEAALRALVQALQQGYGRELLRSDPDLAPLRERLEFQHLVELSPWFAP
jgi:tetratricopeptide (TPR) repeat protein